MGRVPKDMQVVELEGSLSEVPKMGLGLRVKGHSWLRDIYIYIHRFRG